MAWRRQAVELLTRRGQVLHAGQVVVSPEMEPLVREMVQRSPARRANRVIREEVLDLSRAIPPRRPRDRNSSTEDRRSVRQRVERTFVDIASADARSVVTRSTTDAHLGTAMNPRVRVGN